MGKVFVTVTGLHHYFGVKMFERDMDEDMVINQYINMKDYKKYRVKTEDQRCQEKQREQ